MAPGPLLVQGHFDLLKRKQLGTEISSRQPFHPNTVLHFITVVLLTLGPFLTTAENKDSFQFLDPPWQ